MMLKPIHTRVKTFIGIVLVVLTIVVSGCKKAAKTADPAVVNLLVGSSSVWALTSTGFSGNPMALPTCETSFNYIAFYADGTYTQSLHYCELPFGTTLVTPPMGNGQWKLDADNVSLQITSGVFGTYTITSITATTLVLNNGGFTSSYTRVPAQPFYNMTQMLTGTGSKTWKYLKRIVGTTQQTLTADQLALRLTFMSNSSLVKSYTNVSFGQPVNNGWNFEGTRQFGFTTPLAGFNAGNFNYPFLVIELSPASFTFNYYDTALAATVTVYMVPE